MHQESPSRAQRSLNTAAERSVVLNGRSRGVLVLLCLLAAVFPSLAFSQKAVADLAASYAARGRMINDLVVDPAGNVHVAWTSLEKKVHDPGTLFYTRLDHGGRSSAETQVTKYGGVEDIRIDVDSKNRAMVLYVQLRRLCIALFDESGAMRTEMDRMLTPEEADAHFEFSRDERDNLYLFGRGAIDYFWALDPEGNILQERRGRWIRQATPGFICHIIDETTLLFVWKSQEGAAIWTLKFDLSTFSHGAVREYDLEKVAEAKGKESSFTWACLVRSSKDLLYLAAAAESPTQGREYRVRFNARGDPVRRWEAKRMYHLRVDSPHEARCQFRVGIPARMRTEGKSSELLGIGRDGNIYHLAGSLPALRAR